MHAQKTTLMDFLHKSHFTCHAYLYETRRVNRRLRCFANFFEKVIYSWADFMYNMIGIQKFIDSRDMVCKKLNLKK